MVSGTDREVSRKLKSRVEKINAAPPPGGAVSTTMPFSTPLMKRAGFEYWIEGLPPRPREKVEGAYRWQINQAGERVEESSGNHLSVMTANRAAIARIDELTTIVEPVVIPPTDEPPIVKRGSKRTGTKRAAKKTAPPEPTKPAASPEPTKPAAVVNSWEDYRTVDRTTLTALVRDYVETKAADPDAILFYRVGDFYEAMFQDASIVATELELVLTSKAATAAGTRIPLAGVPSHAIGRYRGLLEQKGYKVVNVARRQDKGEFKLTEGDW